MPRFRTGGLQWAVGALCSFTGTTILVVPHRFTTPLYTPPQPFLTFLGFVLLLAGASLLTLTALAARPAAMRVALIGGGAAMLLLGAVFAMVGAWVSMVNYSIWGIGTALVPFLTRPSDRRSHVREADLFVTIAGLSAVATGVLLLAGPQALTAPFYNPDSAWFSWNGAAFLGGGLALLTTVALPAPPRFWTVAAHLLAGGAFWLWILTMPVFSQHWTGILYYGGLGTAIALHPLVGQRLRRFDPRSLRSRLAVALAATAALPLIFAVSFSSARSTEEALVEARETQHALVQELARDILDYVKSHRAAVKVLAAQPELWKMAPEEQTTLLRIFGRDYPAVVAFSTYDIAGRALARSDERALTEASRLPMFLAVTRSGQPEIDAHFSPLVHRLVIVLGAPVRGPDGGMAGVVVAILDSEQLSNYLVRAAPLLSRDGAQVYVVDRGGSVVATSDGKVEVNTDISGFPPVAQFLAALGRERSGSQSISMEDGRHVAAFSEVTGLTLGVVVDLPERAALAGVQRHLDQYLLLLIGMIAVAGSIGAVGAGWLIAPLQTLGKAVERLATGMDVQPMPPSGITEIGELASSFGEMRERLVLRTEERDQAAEQMHVLNAELEDRVQQRTAELATVNQSLEEEVSERAQVEEALRFANEQLDGRLCELQQRSIEDALLIEMGDLLQNCVTSAEIYSIVAEFLPRLIPSVSAELLLLNPSKTLLVRTGGWGDASHIETEFNSVDCWALRLGRLHTSSDYQELACRSLHPQYGQTHMCVPLLSRGEALGMMHLLMDKSIWVQQELLIRHQQLIVAISGHLSLALANVKLQETLRAQAMIDPLTGLFNRRSMEDMMERELSRAMRSGSPLAVLMLDIDHFKQFNDRWGHGAGDVVLRELGAFLQGHVRREDIGCRYGGEEFVLLLVEASLEDALRRAEHLREGVKGLQLWYEGGRLPSLTVSIGVAAYPVDGDSIETLVQSADRSMYRAKRQGRDRVCQVEDSA